MAQDFNESKYLAETELDDSDAERLEETLGSEPKNSKDEFRPLEYLEGGNSLDVYMHAEESTGLEGSLTNNIVKTGVGTVLKEFSNKPKMSYVQAAGRIPGLTLERQDQQDRIDNEQKFREFISDYNIDVPDILGVEDNFVESEALNGTDLNDYINDNPDRAEDLGAEVGDFLNYVHGNDGAVTDLRLNNFMVQSDESLAFLDAEYFVEDANYWEKEMDLITLASSAKQVKKESYEDFMEGFTSNYRDIDATQDVISSVTSLGHAALLERDPERLKNAAENIYSSSKSSAMPFMQ
jgi:tRNA A-37 threonylcarbamoyl transferase component Bud32